MMRLRIRFVLFVNVSGSKSKPGFGIWNLGT